MLGGSGHDQDEGVEEELTDDMTGVVSAPGGGVVVRQVAGACRGCGAGIGKMTSVAAIAGG